MKRIQALVVAGAVCGGGGALAQDAANMRGLTVTVGGGVEGYSGGLAPRLDPGAAYGATATLKPSTVLGIEVGYTGAINKIDLRGLEELARTPDIVRNGGQAVATIGLTASPVQPYLLGGIGMNWYNVRRGGEVLGYRDDTAGAVPLGAGLRFYTGSFTADLRANYNLLFDQELVPTLPPAENQPVTDVTFAGGSSYNAMLNLGATF
ncbi:hypothetical protein HV824_04900 [Myxococcus sp. AM009]|uniref:hypothetical protein n=1 Tax=unclassified Myxococcus TaxID=2648731 RepID=UPI001595FDD5|nr:MULTISPECIES: hypothetical protein [unclassified Myxococcus]NVI97459.1 hypothetical protein [Myxococcus sp. AM009]NVJ15107.1 hypothetical protein [Myxococcus sp. AM010]